MMAMARWVFVRYPSVGGRVLQFERERMGKAVQAAEKHLLREAAAGLSRRLSNDFRARWRREVAATAFSAACAGAGRVISNDVAENKGS